jgi:hypothetical protein
MKETWDLQSDGRPLEQNQLFAMCRAVFGTSDRGYLIVLAIVAD